MKLREIKRYWEEAGGKFPLEGRITPTSRDPYLGLLERENILPYLKKNYLALEIGCGDGSHTLHYARKVRSLIGFDISESLLKVARMRANEAQIKNIDFIVGSVLDVRRILKKYRFNCVISQRCLINLPQWSHQKDTIIQILSLMERGALFLVTEGFQDELDHLNIFRKKFGLSEIRVVEHNRNLIRKDFEKFVGRYLDIIEIHHYGFYLFLSRIFHPLAVLPDEPKHDSRLNEIAMELSRVFEVPDFEKYSYDLFYVLQKK
jgi:SAM-dependent methyltransferase